MQRGLTVIEWLVVISVVGILAGLLIPAFQTARAQAQRQQGTINEGVFDHATYTTGGATGATVIYWQDGSTRVLHGTVSIPMRRGETYRILGQRGDYRFERIQAEARP